MFYLIIGRYTLLIQIILQKLLISAMESQNFMEVIYLQYSFNQYTFKDILWKNNPNLVIMFNCCHGNDHDYGSSVFLIKNHVTLSKYTW